MLCNEGSDLSKHLTSHNLPAVSLPVQEEPVVNSISGGSKNSGNSTCAPSSTNNEYDDLEDEPLVKRIKSPKFNHKSQKLSPSQKDKPSVKSVSGKPDRKQNKPSLPRPPPSPSLREASKNKTEAEKDDKDATNNKRSRRNIVICEDEDIPLAKKFKVSSSNSTAATTIALPVQEKLVNKSVSGRPERKSIEEKSVNSGRPDRKCKSNTNTLVAMLTADPYYDLESDVLLNEKPTSSKSSNETGKNNTQVPEKKGATKINAKKKIKKKKSLKTEGEVTPKIEHSDKEPESKNPSKEASKEDNVAKNVAKKKPSIKSPKKEASIEDNVVAKNVVKRKPVIKTPQKEASNKDSVATNVDKKVANEAKANNNVNKVTTPAKTVNVSPGTNQKSNHVSPKKKKAKKVDESPATSSNGEN